VPAILAIARDCAVPVYPISTGRNWGYGGALPAGEDCAILDLSRLTAIRAIDRDAGLFEVEAGVTQGRMAEYLRERGLPFMVPTTGAGPDASLVGNAIERGYGITPHADHFAAVTRVEAVLADGRVYTPALTAFGTEQVDHAFKWGLGPYVDGLFTQSNLGVVTAMTLALARRSERVEGFYFAVADAAALEEVCAAVRQVLEELGSVTGSINLMNRHRVLAMTAPYDPSRVGADGLLTDDAVRDLGRRYQVDPWMGMGALYGPTEMVAAARKLVRRRLAGLARRLVFLTRPRARFFERLARLVLGKTHAIAATLGRVGDSLEILEGRPNRAAFPLVYWKRGGADIRAPLDPARDGCGLIWYAPLVPFKPKVISAYLESCMRVLKAYRMEPLVTLTTLSPGCVESTVPLLFDRNDPEEVERAHRCHDALLEVGRQIGVAPYRVHVGAMDRIVGSGTYWDVVHELKRALDPAGILAPGRYAPRAGVRKTFGG
jgi:FAD/FMN-containing dehydrogenase